MTFNATKTFNGQKYTGMSVGGKHVWDYTNAVWSEEKVAPDEWRVRFESIKKRKNNTAPDGSGVDTGTQYHWYIIGEQLVQKTDANSYTTIMNARKFKLGHKRPYWKKMSYEYPEQQPLKQQTINYLKKVLMDLEGEKE